MERLSVNSIEHYFSKHRQVSGKYTTTEFSLNMLHVSSFLCYAFCQYNRYNTNHVLDEFK